jgi:hypothetical protein
VTVNIERKELTLSQIGNEDESFVLRFEEHEERRTAVELWGKS